MFQRNVCAELSGWEHTREGQDLRGPLTVVFEKGIAQITRLPARKGSLESVGQSLPKRQRLLSPCD